MATRKKPAAGDTPAAAPAPTATAAPAADMVAPPSSGDTGAEEKAIESAIETALAEGALDGAGQAPAAPLPISFPIDQLIEQRGDAPDGIAVRVVGPRLGRWRAGRHFTPEATIIPLDELGDDELRAIDADQELSWSLTQLEAPEG